MVLYQIYFTTDNLTKIHIEPLSKSEWNDELFFTLKGVLYFEKWRRRKKRALNSGLKLFQDSYYKPKSEILKLEKLNKNSIWAQLIGRIEWI